MRKAPPGCSILDAIMRQVTNSMFKITPQRKANDAQCLKWRDEQNAVLNASTGRICVDIVP
jgi:hypothetical protein